MPYSDDTGVRLYYERAGAGERLLFIGGSGGDLRQKPGVLEGPLAKRFDVLCFDQRGLGRSERPPGPYAMAQYADDAAALLDEVGWRDCLVIGMSFGGMVGQELAIRHPARVRGLVLGCTSSGGSGGASYPLHELLDLAPEERALRNIAVADTRYDASWREANPDAAKRISDFYLASSRMASQVDPEREAAMDGTGRSEVSVEEGHHLQLEARSRHDTHERLKGLALPVLICSGRFDGIAPPANQRALLEAIPGSRHAVFEGGHLFLVQDRSAFAVMSEFLLEA
jgi:3-oxoadipate enol-lactonase